MSAAASLVVRSRRVAGCQRARGTSCHPHRSFHGLVSGTSCACSRRRAESVDRLGAARAGPNPTTWHL